MLIGLLIMALWLNDPGASYNQVYSSAPAYLGGGDAARWQRLRVLKMLYRGNHRGYFLDEQRTQFNYPYEEIEGRLVKRYLTYNLCKLISHTTADLMFGAKVKLDAPTAEQTARLDDLSRDSLLHARFHEAVVQMSWAGGAFLEPSLWNGEPYIEVLPAEEVFPQGRPTPDGQFATYVRYATDQAMIGGRQVTLLLKTTYAKGSIATRASPARRSRHGGGGVGSGGVAGIRRRPTSRRPRRRRASIDRASSTSRTRSATARA
jgi:hypothetical protein